MVKTQGICGVMIRAGYSDPTHGDRLFDAHMNGAVKAGLLIGIYYYRHAMGVMEAAGEANFFLSIIEPYRDCIKGPVAYDVEDENQRNIGKRKLIDVALVFVNRMKDAGCTTMLYCCLR